MPPSIFILDDPELSCIDDSLSTFLNIDEPPSNVWPGTAPQCSLGLLQSDDADPVAHDVQQGCDTLDTFEQDFGKDEESKTLFLPTTYGSGGFLDPKTTLLDSVNTMRLENDSRFTRSYTDRTVRPLVPQSLEAPNGLAHGAPETAAHKASVHEKDVNTCPTPSPAPPRKGKASRTFTQSKCIERQKRWPGLRQRAKDQLKAWFDAHEDYPYPSAEEANALAGKTGFTFKQVKTWFQNTRSRVQRKCMHHDQYSFDCSLRIS